MEGTRVEAIRVRLIFDGLIMGCLHSNAMIRQRNNVGRKFNNAYKMYELLNINNIERALPFVMLFYATVIYKRRLWSIQFFFQVAARGYDKTIFHKIRRNTRSTKSPFKFDLFPVRK